MTPSPTRGIRRTWIASALAILVLLTGVEATLAAGFALQNGPRDVASQAMDRRSELVAEAVSTETRRYTDSMRALAAAVAVASPLDPQRFAALTDPIREMQLAGATVVTYVVPASDADVEGVQREWRQRGQSGLTLRPKGHGEHLFSVLTQILGGDQKPVPGGDASQAPAPSEALAESRRSGDITVSDTYQLLLDRRLPGSQRQNSFALAAPVFAPAGSPDAGHLRGWVLLALRGGDFLGKTLDHAAQGMVDVTLRAQNSKDGLVVVAKLTSAFHGKRELHRELDFSVAQRHWHLDLDSTAAAIPGGSTDLGGTVTTGGLALTAMLAILVFVLSSGRARADAQLVAAAAEIRILRADLDAADAELDSATARAAPDHPSAERGATAIATPRGG
ncbi:MAG: putative PAS-sensor signal transduction histidine kinase [Actinomycetia bacterium]|nr:putative PAS-sensor signal transduction histidine kinase [Actinomycetes bacterium]MDQ1659484.1 hypothetical protein [Cryptosporangiaceae bacterium]